MKMPTDNDEKKDNHDDLDWLSWSFNCLLYVLYFIF